MSCFCASNSTGDSVYSGYFRWRMGLPLPPIPQDEESSILRNTNTEIFNEISGVKNVNDLTFEETYVDNTPKRFRRRKNNQSTSSTMDRFFVPLPSAKHFRENPIYTKSFSQNTHNGTASTKMSQFQFCPIKDEIYVPSQSESFFNNIGQMDNGFYSTKFNFVDESISSFLVSKFLSNVQEFADSLSMDCSNKENGQLDVENSESQWQENNDNSIVTRLSKSSDVMPPAVPPHRKPSTIIEESESECGTVKGGAEALEEELIDTLEPPCGYSDKTTTSIPIYSIKHGEIDKIISGSLSDYDYAYNKSWSKGVELNFAMNLTETKKSKRKLIASRKNHSTKEESMEVVKDEHSAVKEDTPSGVALVTSIVSVTSLTDGTDDSQPVSLPQTSPTPFLKLSSIEADALKQSPTKLSRNSQLSSSFAESETDSRNETWDVMHGRLVKELTGARFIDLSVINNNKPQLAKIPSLDDTKGNLNTNSQRKAALTASLEVNRAKDSLRKSHVNINSAIPLEKQPWYHFYLTRSKSEGLLANHQNGSFLVRRSESNKTDYSLTIKHKGVFLHMKITKNEKGFVLGEYSQPYQSIPHMLYHYCLTMVPVKGAKAACLRFAVARDSP